MLQDLQAEIEAHQHVFESLNNTGRSLVRVEAASDDPKDGKVLAKRLDDMNTRWMQLKTKSVEIRSVNPIETTVIGASGFKLGLLSFKELSSIIIQVFLHHFVLQRVLSESYPMNINMTGLR